VQASSAPRAIWAGFPTELARSPESERGQEGDERGFRRLVLLLGL